MKRMKRVFVLLMVVAMFVSQSPMQVLAETVQDESADTIEADVTAESEESESQDLTISGNDVSTGDGGEVVQIVDITDEEVENEGISLLSLSNVDSLTETLSGQCGDNLTWTIEGSILTISGTGEMWDYGVHTDDYGNVCTDAPWGQYEDNLTELSLDKGITYIGENAFYGCNSFTGDLIIPDGVTEIGDSAFRDCCIEASWMVEASGFTGKLLLPNSITSIGSSAFWGCSGLTGELVLPDDVTYIGSSAFYDCSGFTGDLIIPKNVTRIEYATFDGCEGFNGSLSIPNGVNKIDSYAFRRCSGFKGELNIPNGVTSIGGGAFDWCIGFTGNLYIPVSVKDISYDAFYGCSGFSGRLTIPERLTSISTGAFKNCTGITEVCFEGTARSNVAFLRDFSAGISVYYPTTRSGWDTIVQENSDINWIPYEAPLTGACGNNLTWTIEGNTLTISGTGEMWDYYYDGNYSKAPWDEYKADLTELKIEDGITYIGVDAFYECNGFKGSLVIPEGVTSIGYRSFINCSGFDGELILPNSLNSIAEAAFQRCSNFTGRLIIPNEVLSIGDAAFYGCSGFTGNLVLSDKLTQISGGVFAGCSGFTGSLIIPEGVTSIGAVAFDGCSGFTGSLIIPEGVTSIGAYAFSGCGGFDGELVLPDSLLNIGENAFYNYEGNAFTGNLTIPNSVTSIGSLAFAYCGFDGYLSLSENLITIGQYAFGGCSGLNGNLIFPESVTYIGEGAFTNCSGLAGNLVIPEGIANINDYVFSNCSGFTGNLVISDSVTSIGSYAFTMCSGLSKSLIISENIENIATDAFIRCTNIEEVVFKSDALADVTFLDELPIGINVFYPTYKTGWDKVVQNNADINWIPYDGWCGATVWYSLEEGKTTIYGNGPMDDFGNSAATYILRSVAEPAPWADSMTSLTELKIDSGITHIGSYAFYGANNLDGSLTIPESVETIGYNAFSGCTELNSVRFEGDALEDVSFLNDLPEGIAVYYSADREGWEDIIKENEHINWKDSNMTASISGAIQSFGDEANQIVIRLLQDSEEVAKVQTTNGTYQLEGISDGTYTLEISKPNHVTRTYEITVDGSEVIQDLEIRLIGDITGDGAVTTRDWNRMYAHVNESNLLTGYELQCADVMSADGKVNVRDWNRLYAHINETNLLW